MDLQNPESKMSTTGGTEAGLVYIDDEPEDIVKKVKRAQTDSGSEVVRGPDKAGISNLIEIYAVARGVDPEEVEREFEGQGYGAFKQSVGEARGRAARARAGALPRAARRSGRDRGGAPAGRRPRPRDRRADHGGGALRDGPRAAAVERSLLSGAALKKCLVIPITRRMKALDRPLARPLLIVLMAAVLWTMWATDFGVHL